MRGGSVKRWSAALALGFCASLALAGAGSNPAVINGSTGSGTGGLLVESGAGAAPNPFPAPIVIVYPLTGTGGTPAEVGSNVAILLSSKLADLGGITVKPYTPGTERPDYLTAAIAANADYYITGYLTPVGSDVSLITQIVSTHSGSVTFSSTAVVRTYADVVGQADTLRAAILRHAGRGFPAVDEPATAPSGTPVPSSTGAGVNLSKALSHHARPRPSPGPSASASSAAAVAVTTDAVATSIASAPSASSSARPAPSAGPKTRLASSGKHAQGLVTDVDGDGTPTQRTYAQFSFAGALRKIGLQGGALPVSSADGLKYAGQLCDANPGSKVIFIETLSMRPAPENAQGVELDVEAHDCAGTVIGRESDMETTGKGGLTRAIDRASVSVATAFAKLFPRSEDL